MTEPKRLRDDFSAEQLRMLARSTDDATFRVRFLAIASLYDGESLANAARHWGVGRKALCVWVERFNNEGVANLADARSQP